MYVDVSVLIPELETIPTIARLADEIGFDAL